MSFTILIFKHLRPSNEKFIQINKKASTDSSFDVDIFGWNLNYLIKDSIIILVLQTLQYFAYNY